jgi:RNA polymerase III subunit RPC82 helix-turn-helix domain
MLSRENGNRKSCDFSWKIIVAKSLFYVMTAHEIALVYSIVERNFGTNRARISKIMLETGEMPIKELHRRTSQSSPRISSKIVKDSLHLFFQHDLLLLHSYPDFAEDGPYISFDARQAFFFPTEPAMCYAVEDIFGDEASRAVSLLLAMGTSPAEIFFTEFEQGDRVRKDPHSLLLQKFQLDD